MPSDFFDFSPAESDIARVIRTRRTINDFQPQLPPIETILQGIELARWAPNHKLTEPWRFHLMGPESVREVIDLSVRLVAEQSGPEVAEKKRRRWQQVPGWMAVSCLRSDDLLRDQENYAAVSCAIQNLCLFLWSEGIGTKWSSGPVTRHESLHELLKINPQTEQVVGLIWYGIPSLVPEMRRRSVSEIAVVHP